jgi:secreted trypsin-like serine protease
VGPKHILTAAHCLVNLSNSPGPGGISEQYAPGKAVAVRQAAVASRKKNAPWSPGPVNVLTVAKTTAHASYLEMCQQKGCGPTQFFDGADIGVIEVKELLPKAIPIVPVSAKTIAVGTEVTLAGVGCEIAYGAAKPKFDEYRLKYEVTKTLEIDASVHPGSQIAVFASDRSFAKSLHVVTPGPALDPDAAGLCPGDSGGPLYGPGQQIVVGVAANYTFRPAQQGVLKVPVTNWHTRTDDGGKFPIATWLKSLGVAVQ